MTHLQWALWIRATRLVSRQPPGLGAVQAAHEQRPLAHGLLPPAIDFAHVGGLKLGRERSRVDVTNPKARP